MKQYTKPNVEQLKLSLTNEPIADNGKGHGSCPHKVRKGTGLEPCLFDNGHGCSVGVLSCTNKTEGRSGF